MKLFRVPGMMTQGFNPSTDEAELTFLVYRFPGQARLHRENLSPKNNPHTQQHRIDSLAYFVSSRPAKDLVS